MRYINIVVAIRRFGVILLLEGNGFLQCTRILTPLGLRLLTRRLLLAAILAVYCHLLSLVILRESLRFDADRLVELGLILTLLGMLRQCLYDLAVLFAQAERVAVQVLLGDCFHLLVRLVKYSSIGLPPRRLL